MLIVFSSLGIIRLFSVYLMMVYDMKKEECKITMRNHNNLISDLLLIDDYTFLSCSWDRTIKLCKY